MDDVMKDELIKLANIEKRITDISSSLGDYETHKASLEKDIISLELSKDKTYVMISENQAKLSKQEEELAKREKDFLNECEATTQSLSEREVRLVQRENALQTSISKLLKDRGNLEQEVKDIQLRISECSTLENILVKREKSLNEKEADLRDRESSLLTREGSLNAQRMELTSSLAKNGELTDELLIQREKLNELQKTLLTERKAINTYLVDHGKALRDLDELRKRIQPQHEESIRILEEVKKKEQILNTHLDKIDNRNKEVDAREDRIRVRELRVQKIISDKNLFEEIKKLEV